MTCKCLLLFSAALLLAHGSARSATYVVRPALAEEVGTIQEALYRAAPGDTVLLEDGVFGGEGNRDISSFGK